MSAACPSCEGPSDDGAACRWCRSLDHVARQRASAQGEHQRIMNARAAQVRRAGGGDVDVVWIIRIVVVLMLFSLRVCMR